MSKTTQHLPMIMRPGHWKIVSLTSLRCHPQVSSIKWVSPGFVSKYFWISLLASPHISLSPEQKGPTGLLKHFKVTTVQSAGDREWAFCTAIQSNPLASLATTENFHFSPQPRRSISLHKMHNHCTIQQYQDSCKVFFIEAFLTYKWIQYIPDDKHMCPLTMFCQHCRKSQIHVWCRNGSH